ncbi:MAG: tol-pal system YbgF family protein, partial [Phycisphaerae bacterium]
DAEMRKVIRAHYDEVQADRWYDIGNRFAKLELYKEAAEYFTRVTKEHPNSTAAKRAEERLKELPES